MSKPATGRNEATGHCDFGGPWGTPFLSASSRGQAPDWMDHGSYPIWWLVSSQSSKHKRRNGISSFTHITKLMVTRWADTGELEASHRRGWAWPVVSLSSKWANHISGHRDSVKEKPDWQGRLVSLTVAKNPALCLIFHFHPDVSCQKGTVNNIWILKAETDVVIIPSRPFLPWRRHITPEWLQF